MKFIEELSLAIADSLDCGATRWSIEPFDDMLLSVNMKKFLIHNLRDLHAPMPDRLILSLFKFWKGFSKSDWQEVFDSVAGDSYAEYYITQFSTFYLGIRPFHSGNTGRIVADGEPIVFVGDQQGEAREFIAEDLEDDFGLTIEQFDEIHKRLIEGS
jgi:hypothetical protein